MNLGQLYATLGVNSAGLVKAKADMLAFETAANASLTRINAKLVTTGAAMKKVGKAMTMYLTLPMALVGGAAVKMHMDFESSMSKIVGLVGVAREQVDKWSQDILTMAPQLGKAPKELADAMFFITSAGIRGAEAMDVLKMSAKASVAGLGEVKAVADLVTSAMNAYGVSVLSAELATDVLTATVREGKAEADALATSMGMVLPIASNMGVAFHEVGAAVAAMTRTGTSAATASMQLRQILASLLKPTQQAEEALWNMNTSSAALRKTIKEKGLLTALMDIRKLSAQYGETVMSTVFPNIRALSGVLDVMGANLEDNIAIFKSLQDAAGSGATAFAVAAETFQFKWMQATVTVKTGLTVLGKTIAEGLMPIMLAFGERVRRITEWFRGLDEAQKKTVVRIGLLVMTLGPLIRILGFLVGNILPTLLRLGAGVVKMFYALKIAMAWNPWVILGVGLTAILTALFAFKKKTDDATESQKNLTKAWKDAAGMTETFKEQLKRIGDMNEKQVEDLRRRLAIQLIAEVEYTNEIQKEQFARLFNQDKHQQASHEAMVKANQRRIAELRAYLSTVDIIMAGGGVSGGEGVAPISLAPMSFGTDEAQMLQELGLLKTFSYEKVDIFAEANRQIIADQQEADMILAGIERAAAERRAALANQTKWYVGIISNAFQGMSNVISDALNSSEGFLKGFASFFKDFIKGLIFRLIAATIAAFALAVVLSLLPGFGGAGAFKAVKEAATFGKMIKAGIGMFAEGGGVSGPMLGIVGEGAGISRSNPEFMGTAAQLGLDKIGGQNITINLKGAEIDGDKLVWLVDEIKRKQGNSY